MAKQPTQEPVADESVVSEPVAQEPPTKAELMAGLQKALSEGNFKEVTRISREIDKTAKAEEKAELDAKRAELVAVENTVKDAIVGVITPLYDAGELDKADGIWLSWDFGEQAPTIRLTKTAARTPKAGGGGTGKKFDISTDSLLEEFGDQMFNEEQNFKQAYESNTDKNFRYGIRQKLLKKKGII